MARAWHRFTPATVAATGGRVLWTPAVAVARAPRATAPTQDSGLAGHRLTLLLGPREPVLSTPAGVRAGLPAPYQELAHLTAPRPEERVVARLGRRQPPGGQLLAEHRHTPTAPDWRALIADYADGALAGSTDPRDAAAYDAIWIALPATAHRPPRGPVSGPDGNTHPAMRVLARSPAQTAVAATFLAIEHVELSEA